MTISKQKLVKNGATHPVVSSLILIDKTLTISKIYECVHTFFVKIKTRFLVNFEVYFLILEQAPAGVNDVGRVRWLKYSIFHDDFKNVFCFHIGCQRK